MLLARLECPQVFQIKRRPAGQQGGQQGWLGLESVPAASESHRPSGTVETLDISNRTLLEGQLRQLARIHMFEQWQTYHPAAHGVQTLDHMWLRLWAKDIYESRNTLFLVLLMAFQMRQYVFI